MTSSSFVAPSFPSTPIGTTVSVLTLLASPLPLAQCTGLETDESFRDDVSILEDDLLTWSKEPTLLESRLQQLCDDHVRVGVAPSFKHMDLHCLDSLDLTPVSSPFLPTTPTHLHAFGESVGDISGSQPLFTVLCIPR